MHTCKPSTWEADQEIKHWIQTQPGPQNTGSQKENNNNNVSVNGITNIFEIFWEKYVSVITAWLFHSATHLGVIAQIQILKKEWTCGNGEGYSGVSQQGEHRKRGQPLAMLAAPQAMAGKAESLPTNHDSKFGRDVPRRHFRPEDTR